MFASIHQVRGINEPFRYNENKLKTGEARLILAGNYLKDTSELDAQERLKRLSDRISLNDRVVSNTLHISLNFHPRDILDCKQFESIAGTYMEKIGFGQQPFLVYQHLDAAHPHLHLISVVIKEDGSSMSTYQAYHYLNWKACREIEKRDGLENAENPKKRQVCTPDWTEARQLEYGRNETRFGIAGIVALVESTYLFASLPELNAALRLYQVSAFRALKKNLKGEIKGLLYTVLNGEGRKTGKAIAASLLPGKPMLDKLENRFRENLTAKQSHFLRCRSAIDWVMVHPPDTYHGLAENLNKEGIRTMISEPDAGITEGFIFIDQQTRAVFRDKELGPAYLSRNILDRCGLKEDLQLKPEWQTKDLRKIKKESHHSPRLIPLEMIEKFILRKPDPYNPLPYSLKIPRQILPKHRLGPHISH